MGGQVGTDAELEVHWDTWPGVALTRVGWLPRLLGALALQAQVALAGLSFLRPLGHAGGQGFS